MWHFTIISIEREVQNADIFGQLTITCDVLFKTHVEILNYIRRCSWWLCGRKSTKVLAWSPSPPSHCHFIEIVGMCRVCTWNLLNTADSMSPPTTMWSLVWIWREIRAHPQPKHVRVFEFRSIYECDLKPRRNIHEYMAYMYGWLRRGKRARLQKHLVSLSNS